MTTTSVAPELIAGANRDFLRRHAPFDRMEDAALNFLCERAVQVFHPVGNVVLSPEMGAPRHVYIVQRGQIQMLPGSASTGAPLLTLGPGECFPISAAALQRPSTTTFVAAEDSYCLRIDTEDFLQLLQLSPVLHLYCTQYLAKLLNQSRLQLQSTVSQRAAEQQTMTTPLGQLIKREPVHVEPGLSTRAALEKMAEARIGCMVVVDDARRPIGILTQSDLLPRVVLAGFDLNRPIADVMSRDPKTLPAGATAYDAAMQMATHGVRHLLVVNSNEELVGVVSERDLFSLQRIGLAQIRASIEGASDVEALQRASRDIRQLALNLITQGVGAEQLTQFISALNDALTVRIINLVLPNHGLEEVEFAWLAFGSEGRHEQTLSTDQDNGIIYTVPADSNPETLRSRLLAFAREVNERLADCGFPLCKGNIMASNPELCLTLEGWQQRFSAWLREPDPQALLNATIFFDFRVLWGKEKLGDQLSRWLLQAARNNSTFQRLLAANALDVAPPLGRIRDFVVEEDGCIDLKKFGSRLFVDIARVLALRTGVEHSSTVQRLRQGGSRIGMSGEEIAAMLDGFHFIQLLRLRTQSPENEQAASNRINPDTLNELDRQILKEAFRQARKLQLRVKLDYQL